MAAVAWPSVIAKRGVCVVVLYKATRCCWGDTFAELLSKAAPEITIWPKSQGGRTNSNIFLLILWLP